jgi:hypothetical protein
VSTRPPAGGTQAWDLTLRDGTVYVFGENTPLQSFELLPDSGYAPHARHTATHLTDGRGLNAAGTSDGSTVNAEQRFPLIAVAR